MGRIVVLCGGGGGAKLASGLAQSLAPEDLTIIVNPGDDFEHLGLQVCPDFDSVLYTLSGLINKELGWGRSDESWVVLDELGRLQGPQWFKLGDRDIALHITRLAMAREGLGLTQIAERLTEMFQVHQRVLPLTDDPLRTVVDTDDGMLSFQRYFVERRCAPRVNAVRYTGAEEARMSEKVDFALRHAELAGVIIGPSNPYLSIGPMLALPAFAQCLRNIDVPVLAVSPIVAGKALKGPAAKIMAELGIEPTAANVARYYGDLLDGFVLDEQDREQAQLVESRCFVTNTVMASDKDREVLARKCVQMLAELR